jgi:hypothetical protein
MLVVSESHTNFRNGTLWNTYTVADGFWKGGGGLGVTLNMLICGVQGYSVHTTVKQCVYINVPPFKMGSSNTTLPFLLFDYLWSESTGNISTKTRARICKHLRSPGIDSEASIP